MDIHKDNNKSVYQESAGGMADPGQRRLSKEGASWCQSYRVKQLHTKGKAMLAERTVGIKGIDV